MTTQFTLPAHNPTRSVGEVKPLISVRPVVLPRLSPLQLFRRSAATSSRWREGTDPATRGRGGGTRSAVGAQPRCPGGLS